MIPQFMCKGPFFVHMMLIQVHNKKNNYLTWNLAIVSFVILRTFRRYNLQKIHKKGYLFAEFVKVHLNDFCNLLLAYVSIYSL